jgi:hypothetical protein
MYRIDTSDDTRKILRVYWSAVMFTQNFIELLFMALMIQQASEQVFLHDVDALLNTSN